MVTKSLNRCPNIARFLAALHSYGQVSLHDLANRLEVKPEDLQRWQVDGGPPTPNQQQRLIEFCEENNLAYFLADSGITIPTYDWRKTFEENADYFGPWGVLPSPATVQALLPMPTYLCGKRLNFPIGVAASALTANSIWVTFYARRGFDLITYKSVRPRPKDAHPAPNWVSLEDVPDLTVKDVEEKRPLIAREDNWLGLEAPRRLSMANSFGIPSTAPEEWKEDIKRAKAWLVDGQLLVVSVFSDENAGTEEDFIAGYVDAAKTATEAGADIIEANLSCPNTFISGEPVDIYRKPELAGRVASAIKKAIGEGLPLFIKIGYLSRNDLATLLEHTVDAIDGVTAINAISMPVQHPDGREYFPLTADKTPRANAGISGCAIQSLAMEVVGNLIELRRFYKPELAVIAVGGVTSPSDFADYRRLGADAVQCVTGAWLNPDLALECRLESHKEEESVRTRAQERKAEVEAKVLFKLYNAKEMTLDHLGEEFEKGLRPSDIETAEEFGHLIANLEARNLIEFVNGKGVPSYRFTVKGRKLIGSAKASK